MKNDYELTAIIEPFDSFWEAPKDIEKGYGTFCQFYKHNYLKYIPKDKSSKILVISCGFGYFIELLKREGYFDVLGIDSFHEKIKYAERKKLNSRVEKAFPFLWQNKNPYDVVIAEQEINHLTKEEIRIFLGLCMKNLKENGTLIVHSLNGANPITGSEALAQNFDHYNTFTEYSLRQLLEHAGFSDVRVFPLNLYVFFTNPLNYIGLIYDKLMTFFFRLNFILYGKSNKIFSKKIGAVCKKEKTSSAPRDKNEGNFKQ